MKKYSLALVLICLGYKTNAQTIVTDRPDQTESSTTVPSGSFQIESGILVGFTDIDNISERQILLPTNLFRIGISKGIELRVLSQFESVENKTVDETFSGISDLEVGAKVQLFKKDEAKTEIAFLSHVIIPTAKDELTLGEVGTINKLSFAHDIGDTFALGYNVGYDYYGFGSGNLTYSLSLGLGISDKVGMYIEPFGTLVEMDTHEASFDAGFTYLVRDNLQLDVSAGTGLNHKMKYVSIGCSIIIAKEKNQKQ